MTKRWARNRDACIVCGRSDEPHKALGFCASCYNASRKRYGRIVCRRFRVGDLFRDRRSSPEWVGAAVVIRTWIDNGQDWVEGIDIRDMATLRSCRTADAVKIGGVNMARLAGAVIFDETEPSGFPGKFDSY